MPLPPSPILVRSSAEGSIQFSDGMKFDNPPSLFFAAKAVWQFEAEKGRLPLPNNEAEADEVRAWERACGCEFALTARHCGP